MNLLGFIKPKLVVSRCFLNQNCRYNGVLLNSPLQVFLKNWVEIRSVCPEMEMGLSVPREPIEVVEIDGDYHLKSCDLVMDFTDSMDHLVQTRKKDFFDCDGFLLKARSPSCGVMDTSVFDTNMQEIGIGPGLFAKKMQEEFTYLPFADENLLLNHRFREFFLVRICAFSRLRESISNLASLCIFHLQHSHLIYSFDHFIQEDLDELILHGHEKDFEKTRTSYINLFRLALSNPFLDDNILETFEIFMPLLAEGEQLMLRKETQKARERRDGYHLPRTILTGILKRKGLDLDADAFLCPFPVQMEEDLRKLLFGSSNQKEISVL